jgi:Zn-dependent protease
MFGTGSRIQVARIGGIPIYVSYSWFVIVLLFGVAIYSDRARAVDPSRALQLTVLTVVLFFGGILLHEAAHAIAARSFGLPVRAITLVFWGGATETRSWRKGPLADFVVAASGPATTAVIGVTFVFLAGQTAKYSDLYYTFRYLGDVNLLFALFNAIPGFPLDGGRMLMAVAWGITRRRALALRVAGIGSLIVGGGLILWAVLRFGEGDGLAIFIGYIGFVMVGVGRQIPPRAKLRERLERGTASDAMRPITNPIPADMTLYEATEGWLRGRPQYVFPVAAQGTLVGTISLEDAAQASAARPVSEAMVALREPPLVEADEPLDDVVEWIGERDALVVDPTKRTVGLIAIEDVDRWLKAHWSTGDYVEAIGLAPPPRPDQ